MTRTGWYYARDGQPLDQLSYLQLSTDDAYRRVAWTEIGVGPFHVDVSTVWLGIDHSFGQGPPLIFETMIFGGRLAGAQRRYSTEESALEGHAEMVAEVRPLRNRIPRLGASRLA